MKPIRSLIAIFTLLVATSSAMATTVRVKMNEVSTRFTLVSKTNGQSIDPGEEKEGETQQGNTVKMYEFEAPADTYVLSGYDSGDAMNGTIELNVVDSAEPQEFVIVTVTTRISNQNTDKTYWSVDAGDYTIALRVSSREGQLATVSPGKSSRYANSFTFLAFHGNSYFVKVIPTEKRQAEGFATLYLSDTLNWNTSTSKSIPKGINFSASYPADAHFELNYKLGSNVHYIDFTPMEPVSTETVDGVVTNTYYLSQNTCYNYRTSREGALTLGGKFFSPRNTTSGLQKLEFKESDYAAYDPHKIIHDVTTNDGYETGDIFVNINEQGYKTMKSGDSFKALGLRTWQLTDDQANNYFIEPDFHYTVLDLEGKPSSGVIEITQKQGSCWADLKAVGKGTAIVLVTYDAIKLNQYKSNAWKPYMGGEFWSAIWPENTAAYVVSVDETPSKVNPMMLCNAAFNPDSLKTSGVYVDAEHDVFYYLDTEKGYNFSFKPENCASVTMAYPTIGERMATYTGFGTEGVTKNDDGSYTLLLKEGRQIVKMTDADGNSCYQVLTSKKCHRELSNLTRPDSKIFQPGDMVKIQYSGLRHPANKISGIYNMSAYVQYNGTANGSSLILSPNQYRFGSTPSAQAFVLSIPEDYDAEKNQYYTLDEGVIQVLGYGDPIGNHRIISYVGGRTPNFTAVVRKTFFGSIPNVDIPVLPMKMFDVNLVRNTDDVSVTLSRTYSADSIRYYTPAADGHFALTYGDYDFVCSKPGYRCYRGSFSLVEGQDDDPVVIKVDMVKCPGGWDGKTLTEPAKNESGKYVIEKPAELAWLADYINKGNTADAVLARNVDLADYDWTPIGNSSKKFAGTFTGGAHRIDGLYIDRPELNYVGLFGYVDGKSADAMAAITGITVSGKVVGKQMVAGVAGYVYRYTRIDTCANYADVTAVFNSQSGGTAASGKNAGGIAGFLSYNTSSVSNCYNAGTITATNSAGGIVGGFSSNTSDNLENVYNIGDIKCENLSSAIIGSKAASNVKNAYATKDYELTGSYTLVTDEQMASGEIAYKLGKAFGQKLGEDPYPVFGAPEVLFDESTGKYYNNSSAITDVTTDGASAVPVMYYNLQGIPSVKPYEGLNIVRYSDGSARKEYRKAE